MVLGLRTYLTRFNVIKNNPRFKIVIQIHNINFCDTLNLEMKHEKFNYLPEEGKIVIDCDVHFI